MTKKGIENLTQAIVLRAIRDYKSAMRGKCLAGIKPDIMIYRCENFFKSEWFVLLTNDNINGGYLIKQLQKIIK